MLYECGSALNSKARTDVFLLIKFSLFEVKKDFTITTLFVWHGRIWHIIIEYLIQLKFKGRVTFLLFQLQQVQILVLFQDHVLINCDKNHWIKMHLQLYTHYQYSSGKYKGMGNLLLSAHRDLTDIPEMLTLFPENWLVIKWWLLIWNKLGYTLHSSGINSTESPKGTWLWPNMQFN